MWARWSDTRVPPLAWLLGRIGRSGRFGPSMTAIPWPTPPYAGTIGRLTEDCQPVALKMEGAPEGAPNVVIVLLDDVGFGSFGAFGGPVPALSLIHI